MDATTKEIATLLRATDDMAQQFVQRVQSRVDPSVSAGEVLAAMKKISVKSISMEKVVNKVQQQRSSKSGRSSRQPTARSTPRSPAARRKPAARRPRPPASTDGRKEPQTLMERLEAVLQENWDRAEAEGLQPDRMEADAFVQAIYQFTDRREGTRRRILQAAKKLNAADVILSPALVADTVHELFEE
jgi:hypothetical protein